MRKQRVLLTLIREYERGFRLFILPNSLLNLRKHDSTCTYIYIYISRKRTLLPTFVIIVPIKIKIDLICIKSRKSFQILVRLDPIDVPNNRTKFRIFWKKENKNRKTAVWKKSRIRAIESESKASHLLIRIANGDSLFPLTAGIGNSVSAKEHPFNPSIGARLTCCANPRERGRIHEARVS